MDVGVMEILIHKEGMVATETHTEVAQAVL